MAAEVSEAPVSDPLGAVGRRLAERIEDANDLPEGADRQKAIRAALARLRPDVSTVASGADETVAPGLDAVAAVVREMVPRGAENPLPTRDRVFIRLLRADGLEPAWTLAEDNAAGVAPRPRAGVTWAGGPELSAAPPSVPTMIENGRVFAWLPGFRDPRWGVPDDVYEITGRVDLRVLLERASLTRERLLLAGSAYLNVLTTRADEDVSVVFAGPGGRERRVPATRVRSPEHVQPASSDLGRLAWAGWYVSAGVAALPTAPGRWSVRLEVTQAGLRRAQILGPRRGHYADAVGESGPIETGGVTFRLTSGRDDRIVLVVTRGRPRDSSS